jgi:hypothetical protein
MVDHNVHFESIVSTSARGSDIILSGYMAGWLSAFMTECVASYLFDCFTGLLQVCIAECVHVERGLSLLE